MKLHIDADGCRGHGRCYSLAPDLLTSDDEGYVTIRGSFIELSEDQRELGENIEGSCPEGAIELTDD